MAREDVCLREQRFGGCVTAAMAEPSSSTLQRPMEPAFDEADIDYSDIEAAYDVQMDELSLIHI